MWPNNQLTSVKHSTASFLGKMEKYIRTLENLSTSPLSTDYSCLELSWQTSLSNKQIRKTLCEPYGNLKQNKQTKKTFPLIKHLTIRPHSKDWYFQSGPMMC